MRGLIAVLAGLVVGGLTSPLQTVSPGAVGSLANSGTPWTLVAIGLVFWAGANGFRAAALGFATLAAEVVGYYVVAALRGFDASPAYVVFWLVAALVFGAVGGYAAGLMRGGPVWQRLAGMAVPVALLLGEGLYIAVGTGNPALTPYGIWSMVLGVIVGLVWTARMSRTARQRVLAPVGMLLLAAIVFGGIEAANAVM